MVVFHKTHAFTLIESVIGAALIVLILFVIITLFPSSVVALRQSQDVNEAAWLAQQSLETQVAHVHGPPAAPVGASPTVNNTVFTVKSGGTQANASVQDLDVTVQWNEGGTTPQTVTFNTAAFDAVNP